MKVRADFVTNSSSSSFIIAYKKPDFAKETIDQYPELQYYLDVIENILNCTGYETTEAEILTTKEQLNEYFIDRYCYETLEEALNDDSWLKTRYDECVKYLNEGFTIAFKSVGNSDESVDNLLHKLDNGRYFVILSDY